MTNEQLASYPVKRHSCNLVESSYFLKKFALLKTRVAVAVIV